MKNIIFILFLLSTLASTQGILQSAVASNFVNIKTDFDIKINRNLKNEKCENIAYKSSINLNDMNIENVNDNIVISDDINYINLHNNSLKNIPNIFKSVPYLSCFNISKNKIHLYEINPIQHSQLMVLDLSTQVQVKYSDQVKPEFMDMLKSNDNETEIITYQNMEFNNFGMYLPSLEILILSHNEISSLSSSFNMSFPNLKYLYLINIDADELHPAFFERIPKSLTVIHLENNNLKTLKIHKAEITALYLDKNPLKIIDIISTKLKILSLSKCTSFSKGIIDTPNLQQLDLSMNDFDSVSNINFDIVSSLKILILDHNKLLKIPLLIHLQQLSELSLSYNTIRYVQANSLYYLSSLTKLSLKGNVIQVVDSNAFLGLENLKYLDLSENKLKKLPYTWMLPLLNLEYLNANSNQFENILDLSINHTILLKHLCVINNIFTKISKRELNTLSNIINVYIA